jgi:hypothetical protein
VSTIKRWDRSTQVDRTGELRESNEPEFEQDLEQPPVEDLLALQFQKQRFQDTFDPNNDPSLGGVDGTGKRSPAQVTVFDKALTTEDFEQRLQETLEGKSERAQQVKQIESVYEVYFKDTEDFPIGTDLGPGRSVTAPELPRYEAPAETAWKGRAMTVPEFQAVTDPSEARPEQQQVTQAAAALQESQQAAEEAQQPLSLLDLERPKVRA